MIRSSLLILFLLSTALGDTHQSASTSYADVFAAVSSSANGDVVQLPPGHATWASTLSLNKPITVLGSGTNLTIISSGSSAISVALLTNLPVRVSGITFNNSGSVPTVVIIGKSFSGYGTEITDFRIDHCRFIAGKRAINPVGYCYGVIDHCSFINNDISVGMQGDDNLAWARPMGLGTTNCVCIEDCEFLLNSTAYTGTLIYHQEGNRTCLRHCSFSATATSPDPAFIECHGNGNYYTGNNNYDTRGQIFFEIYSNTFHFVSTYRMSIFRGGTIMCFGNSWTCDSGNPSVIEMSEEESWQANIFNPLRTVWPAEDQITNSFFWGNTKNGNPVTQSDVVFSYPSDSVFIQEGRDYWMAAPNGKNGLPSGIYSSYTPLVYPHPRVTSDGGGTPPEPPVGVASVSARFTNANVGTIVKSP